MSATVLDALQSGDADAFDHDRLVDALERTDRVIRVAPDDADIEWYYYAEDGRLRYYDADRDQETTEAWLRADLKDCLKRVTAVDRSHTPLEGFA